MSLEAHVVGKIALVCFLLFGPSAIAGQWETIATMPGLEYLPESAHRIGDRVYLIHRNTPREGAADFVIADDLDCQNQALRISWANGSLGKVTGRYYNNGKSQDRYASVDFKAADTDQVFYDWACKLPLQPERLVNVRTEQEGALTQVDISSVKRIGAVATLWMRHDYPTINFDPPYNAPFDSKREFVRLNCDTSRYSILVGYDFMPDGTVTDGMIAPEEDTALTPSDSYAAAKEIACNTSMDLKSFAGIGGITSRPKPPLPPKRGIEDVAIPTEVAKAVARLLSILPDEPVVSEAKITQTSKSSLVQTSRQVIVVIKPKKDGTTRVQEIYDRGVSVDREVLGPVQLKSKMNSNMAEPSDVTLTTSLTVNSGTWAAGQEFSFEIEMPATAGPKKFEMSCKIGEPIEANTIHRSLAGHAWPLECDRKGDSKMRGYYVGQLRYFFVAHSESSLGRSDSTIDGIEIGR